MDTEQRKATLRDLKLEQWFRKREAGEIVWKTKDGNLIPINEMSDSHLQNAINHVEERNYLQAQWEEACEAYFDSNW